jgi:recombination protein RecT
MTQQVSKSIPPNPVVALIRGDKIQQMVHERLGKRAGQFTTSLISLVNANKNIAECNPITVIQAALTAASMDLPINQNLGFAYIVPYKNHGKMEAQFQMGWKGFVQLAQRSGKFKTINTTDVRESEVKTRDRMTGELEFNWIADDAERKKQPVIGYLAYFKLLNGFNKSLYMTKAEVEAHAGRYSQAYKAKGKSSFKSPWETDFDLMAQKDSS